MLGKIRNQFGYEIDLDALFMDALASLTGRNDVELRFTDPPSRGALASLARDMDGRLIVWISDRLPLNAQYDLFLHEAAHVVKHSHKIPRSQAAAVPAGHLVNVARESKQPDYMADEGEADRLRDEWRAWVGMRTIQFDTTLEGYPPEVYKLIIILKGYGK